MTARRVKDCKAKGTRAEHRTMRVLEAAGYVVTRAGASLGLVDVIAVGPHDVRLIQVKCGGEYLRALEREQLVLLRVPLGCSKECWRWPPRATAPVIEVL